MTTYAISDETFEQDVLKSNTPVIVDFWAEWCGPCKALGPVLEETAQELGEKVKITKVNIDENPMTPTKYGVRGVPTLMVFQNGELKDTRVGGGTKQDLVSWIEGHL